MIWSITPKIEEKKNRLNLDIKMIYCFALEMIFKNNLEHSSRDEKKRLQNKSRDKDGLLLRLRDNF